MILLFDCSSKLFIGLILIGDGMLRQTWIDPEMIDYADSIKFYCGNTYFDLVNTSNCGGFIFFSCYKNLMSFWLLCKIEIDGKILF